MNEYEQQGFVEQDTALESMRASDFDCYSAYGEVIDNSIQAYATEINIDIIERKDRQATKRKSIGQVIFSDNGEGMDIDLLHRCLKLGHSSRYNDRSGIGRFGVGMTLGAIHECKRIEVYSKIKGSKWHYTYLDLDEIKEGKLKHLPYPTTKDPSFDNIDFIKDHGTIVVWTKYDKQVDPFETIIKESRFWIGRTFRRFLWGTAIGYKEVKISLNGKEINAFDPLFVTKKKTGFEDEPSAKLLEPDTIEWTVPVEANSDKQKSNIDINISLLPDKYRQLRGQGGTDFAKERNIDKNEGISIMRNDREVYFGWIPNGKIVSGEANRNKCRYIGCEISFTAELDTEFSVKNIKRGAVPIRELKKAIVDKVKPTFKTQIEYIENKWNELERDKQNIKDDKNLNIGVSSSHGITNDLLSKQKNILKNDKAGKKHNDEVIAKKIKSDASKSEIQNIVKGLQENGITIDEREFIGDTFIDIEHGNKLKILLYNTNSNFFKSYKEILNELESKNYELAKEYKVLIDLIFVGYMLAESQIDPEEEIDGAFFTQELKSKWALELSKILRKWKN